MRVKFYYTIFLVLLLSNTPLLGQKLLEKMALYVGPGVAFIPGKENLTTYYIPKNAFGSFKPGLSLDICLFYFRDDRWSYGLDVQYFFAQKSQQTINNTSIGPLLKFNFVSTNNSVSPFVLGGPRFGYTYLSRTEYRLSENPPPSSDTKLVDIQNLDLHFGYTKFGVPCFGLMAGAGIDFRVNKRLKVFVLASYTYQFEKNNHYLKESFPENTSNLSFLTGEVGLSYQLKQPKKNRNKAIAHNNTQRREQTLKNIAHGAKKDPPKKPEHAPATVMKLKTLSKEGLDPNKRYVVSGQVEGANAKNIADQSVLILDEKGNVVAKTKPDKNGRFAYKGLKPDNYTMALSNKDPSLNATANMSAEDPSLKVDAAAMNKFAYNRLNTTGKPAGVIVGESKLNGNSKEAADQTMLLLDGKGNVVGTTQTDKNGKFAFRNLKSDNYQIVPADNPTIKATALSSTTDPNLKIDENDFKKFQLKKLSNGQSPEPVVTGKIHTSGYLKDASDQTVLMIDKDGNVVAETKASKDGRFAFKGLQADNYQAVLANGDPLISAKAKLSSTDPSLKTQEADFFKFGKLGGTGAPEKFVTGKVDLSANQQNTADATALLVDDNGKVVDAVPLTKDGSFAFKNVRAANYQVVVEGADYDKMVFDVSKNDAANSSLSSTAFSQYGYNKLKGDASPQNVVVGKIDVAGQTLPTDGVGVLLLDESGKIVERVTSDKEGNFTFQNVRAANYQAVAEGQDYKKIDMQVANIDNAPKISKSDFSKHFQKLSSDAADNMVVGRVNSSMDGKTAENQTVLLIDGNGDVIGRTIVKKEGVFTFNGLKADNYQTVLEKPDPAFKANVAAVIKDPEMKVSVKDVMKYNMETKKMEHLTEEDHVIITGTIRSDDFMAVENRSVLLLDQSGEVVKEVFSNKNGVFKFGGIKAKEYQVVYQDGDKHVNPVVQMYKDNDPAITEQGGKIAKTMYYDLNQTELNEKDKVELEKFVAYYKQHPNMKMIKLNAYGDATGTEEANMHVTQKRAQLVMEYLKSKGVPSDKVKLNPLGKSLKFKNKHNVPDSKLNRKVDIEIVE